MWKAIEIEKIKRVRNESLIMKPNKDKENNNQVHHDIYLSKKLKRTIDFNFYLFMLKERQVIIIIIIIIIFFFFLGGSSLKEYIYVFFF